MEAWVSYGTPPWYTSRGPYADEARPAAQDLHVENDGVVIMATAKAIDGVALALRQQNAARWLGVGQFVNSCTWTVASTAQTGLGLQLAPSRAALLATMSAISSLSAAAQFLLLPFCGALSDALGRKPVMIVRALASTVFPALLAAFPSYKLFICHRAISMLTWHLTESAQQAALADVFEGQELAVAMAKCRSQMGIAMLIGPLIGGWLSERSFRACYMLSAACGAVNTLLYATRFRETLGSRAACQPSADAGVDSTATTENSKGSDRHVAGKIDYASANPLGFLKLFRNGRALTWLAIVSTISEACDGTYESAFHPRLLFCHRTKGLFVTDTVV